MKTDASAVVIGFAGLGRMGGPMSRRLVAAGYPLVGFDPAGSAARVPVGARTAESIAHLALDTDVLLLSVPDGVASRAICAEVAATEGRRAATVIDLSTIGVAAARACDALLRAVGVEYIDAPVSGGVAGAESGSLATMVGASQEAFDRWEPVLAVIAHKRFRVGDAPGQGQAMKLVNNYASAAALAATCEAVVLGERMGLDLATMVDVLNASSGRSSASEDKFPRSIVTGTYDYGFAAALMTKDVRLYLENATTAEVPRDLATAVVALWQRFTADQPDADFTALHRYLAEG